MMKRLVDQRGAATSVAEAKALELLRAATPLDTWPARKERILSRVMAALPRRASWALRPVVVTAVVVGCASFAGASLGRWPSWMAVAFSRLVSTDTPVTAPAAPPHARRKSTGAPGDGAVGVSAEPAALLAPEAAPSQRGLAAPERRRRHDAERRLRAAAPPAATDDDTALVLAAVRALRRERAPARARALLDDYLSRHPGGALAEEALALSIEAAIARHDRDARALASLYLRRYPQGPFRAVAAGALAATDPR